MFFSRRVAKLSVGTLLTVAIAVMYALPLEAALVTQSSSSIISSASNVVASSYPVAAFGLNISASAVETLDSVAVTITDVGSANITIGDFAALSTTDTSGFALYADDAVGNNGTWDSTDDLVATTSVANVGMKVTIDVNAVALPADDIGTNAGTDFFIVFRTSGSFTNGDDFTLGLAAASDVVYSTGPSVGMATITTATITGDTVAPTISSRTTVDSNGDGKIQAIDLVFTENLRDDFGGAGVSAAVADYVGDAVATDGADDNRLRVTFTQGGTVDTDATPLVQLTSGGMMRDRALGGTQTDGAGGNRPAGNLLAAEVSATAATDGAGPIMTAAEIVGTGVGGVTYNGLKFTYSEDVQISNGGTFASSGEVTSSTTLGDMRTARTIAGIATLGVTNGGDMATILASDNVVTANGDFIIMSFNRSSGSYFSSGTTAPTTPVVTPISNVAAIKDLANNPVNATNTPTATVAAAWDVTAPTIVNTYSCDVDHDGDIERFQINFSENMFDAGSLGGYYEGDNNSSNDGVGEESPYTTDTDTQGCDGGANDSDSNDEKLRFDLATGITGTDVAYVNLSSTTGPRDHAGNRAVVVAGGGTENDMARPVLVASSPADNATGVSALADIALVFSEAMNTTAGQLTYTDSNTSGTYSETWSSDATYGADAKVTIAQSGSLLPGSHTFTIVTAPAATGTLTTFYGAATGGAAANPFDFTIASSGDNDGGAITVTPTYSAVVTSPNGGETFTGGETEEITWSASSSNNALRAVTISYSMNGGTSYSTIVTNTQNDGSYSWTVPDVDAGSVWIKVEGTDLVTTLATDTSNASFAIVSSDAAGEAPSSGETGVSPVTGEVESISLVGYGDYVKSPSFSTVYYIDRAQNGSTLVRRPFMDAQTFKTYEDSWGVVQVVTDATLPTLSLGAPMLPKAGTVLVKIQSDARVYVLADGGELRWLTTEALATQMYGSDWSAYVIDVPVTLFPRFSRGEDVTMAEDADMGTMKTRHQVND